MFAIVNTFYKTTDNIHLSTASELKTNTKFSEKAENSNYSMSKLKKNLNKGFKTDHNRNTTLEEQLVLNNVGSNNTIMSAKTTLRL